MRLENNWMSKEVYIACVICSVGWIVLAASMIDSSSDRVVHRAQAVAIAMGHQDVADAIGKVR